MSAREHRFGSCDVIASARLRGRQPEWVRGADSVGTQTGTPHISLRIGGVLLYLEDLAALESLRQAVRKADRLAADVFADPADRAHTRRG